ncbi:hypothetical protein ACFLXQ_00055 [Chloroflexota bacterium]
MTIKKDPPETTVPLMSLAWLTPTCPADSNRGKKGVIRFFWNGHLEGSFAQPARLIAKFGERRAQPIAFDPDKQPESIDCTRLVQTHRMEGIEMLCGCICLALSRPIVVSIITIMFGCEGL